MARPQRYVLLLAFFSLASTSLAQEPTVRVTEPQRLPPQERSRTEFDYTADGPVQLLDTDLDSAHLETVSATSERGKSCSCGKCMAKKAAGAHKVVFYNNDFSYLDDPSCCGGYLGDNLKRIRVGDCWTFDFGGQYRLRFHSEQNIRNSGAVTNALGLTGNDDDFLLHRTRLYSNIEYGDHFRFYAEMIDAYSELGANGANRPIEENRADLNNFFLELRGMSVGNGTLGARVGRQELLLGAQRLVSPLDWANTRRTFDGARVTYQGEMWNLDGIWARPMRRNDAFLTKLDRPNLDRQLYGVYGTYKGLSRDNLEVYWLALDYEDVGASGFRYDTVGARYYGSEGNWLYELEGGYQFGENSDTSNHEAGFATMGIGRKFPCTCFQPTVWLFYDWASGADQVGNGFHHYEPLAHKYNGFMDIFGRRNLQDINAQVTATLNEKTKLLIWYHYFALAKGNDVPYNVTMTNFAGLATGSPGSKDLGHEIDLVVTRKLTPRSSVLVGYSHFFAGNFYASTPGVPFNGDANFTYVQWHTNF